MAYIQSNNPFKKADVRRTIGRGKNFNPVSKDKSATGAAAGGGITQKPRKVYQSLLMVDLGLDLAMLTLMMMNLMMNYLQY